MRKKATPSPRSKRVEKWSNRTALGFIEIDKSGKPIAVKLSETGVILVGSWGENILACKIHYRIPKPSNSSTNKK